MRRLEPYFPLSRGVPRVNDRQIISGIIFVIRNCLVLRDEKKLFIAALSQTLPDLLIEQVTPLSAMSRWNCSLVYWLPWSEW